MLSKPEPALADAGGGMLASADAWVIEARHNGLFDRARELWRYRYLWWFFARRTIQSLYRGTTLGAFWLIVRVSGPISISTLFFGGLLGLPSEQVPYFLFFLAGTTTWTLFDRSLLFITRSMERNRKLIRKVYFPRLILPIAAIAPALVYLAVLSLVLAGTVVYYHRLEGKWYVTWTPRLLVSAGAVAMSLAFSVAVGLWTSVLQARYRDVRFTLRYVMSFWFYFTPVVYPLSHVPEQWRWVVAINPMAAIVEAFKWGTLGIGSLSRTALLVSTVLIVLTLVSGLWFFNREESSSVDKL